jgi:uncharacterized PurR-regulated membrane protein YhhQ (DUF165 family)
VSVSFLRISRNADILICIIHFFEHMGLPRRHHRYYDLILAAFVVVLLCSNFIGAGKAAAVDLPYFGTTVFGAGVLFFPIAYFFGDILTEVYGYAYDRRAVWAGFAALAFAAVMAQIVIALPVAPGTYMANYQQGLETVFGNSWRIALPRRAWLQLR